MERTFTIVWLIQGDEQYGVRRMVLSLTQALQAFGWRTPIVSLMDSHFARECRDLGMQVTCLNTGPAPNWSGPLAAKGYGFLRLLRFRYHVMRQLIRTIVPLKPDGLHVLWPNLMPIAGGAARRLGIPCFWEMPNYVGGKYPFSLNRVILQRQIVRNGVIPLAISRYSASTLGDRPVKPVIFHLGADESRFDPEKVIPVRREELAIPSDAVVLGIFARIEPGKGQDRVLEAILRIREHLLHLVLLGGPTEDSFAASLRTMAGRGGSAERLHFMGMQSEPERYYDMIDIAVNSRIDPEPFGLSVVEAMMMGRPVLVHAAGGPAETVVDGVTGWHVAGPSVESIEAGIRRAIADRPRWNQMRDAARRRALEHFTTAGQARRYHETVKQTITDREANTTPKAPKRVTHGYKPTN